MKLATNARRAFVISDENVLKLHGETVVASLREAGIETETYTLPPGDASKSLAAAGKVYDWFAGHRAERRDAVFALGGGMVGDLAGFVAACESCIAEGLGPAAFWQLLKADQYIAFATGERELEDYEWSPGEPILHPELLPPAAEALAAALASSPGLREDESARGLVGDWNLRFAAVVQQSEFGHLARLE